MTSPNAEVTVNVRIEGKTGTIFHGIILTTGKNVTTTNPVPYIGQVESFGQSQTSQVGYCENTNSDQSFRRGVMDQNFHKRCIDVRR